MIGSAKPTSSLQPTYSRPWACSTTAQSSALSRMCIMGYSPWCVPSREVSEPPLTAPSDDPSERLRR